MARLSIQDTPSPKAELSFERQPPRDLEETLPFSLLNALLDDVEGAVRYEPPALQALVMKVLDEPIAEIPEPVAEIPEPIAEIPEPIAEIPEPIAEIPEPVAEIPEPIAEIPEPVAEIPEPVAEAEEEPVASVPEEPLPLPVSFPKLTADLPPPPPPPRPKRSQFSVKLPSFSPPSLTPSEPAQTDEEKRPSIPNQDNGWPRRKFHSTPPKLQTFDPIDKAVRIFESLSSIDLPEAPRAEITAEVPTPASDPVEAAKPIAERASTISEEEPEDVAELDTVKIKLPTPKAKASSPTEVASEEPPVFTPTPKPEIQAAVVEPVRREALPAAPPSLPEIPVVPLSTPANVPAPQAKVPLQRRRRRRVPVNPWTAKSVDPLTQGREVRRKHIDQTLGALAKMLEATLDIPVPVQAPIETESVPATVSPTNDVALRKAFPAHQGPPVAPQAKVKLVPRAIKGMTAPGALEAQADANVVAERPGKQEFELTAPTTLVADNAPISPFTKVAQGYATVISTPPADPTTPPAASPFRLANPSVETGGKVFASPFSSAIKKRDAAPAAEGAPAPALGGLKVAPIQPPGAQDEQDAFLASGKLPAPTYSFSTMGIPSGQAKVPSRAAPAAVTAVPMPSQTPPTAAPVPPAPFEFHPAQPALETKTAAQREAPKKAKRRAEPDPDSWGILTWLLCFFAGGSFLFFAFKIYQTLSNPLPAYPAPIPHDAPDFVPDNVLLPDPAPPVEPVQDLPESPSAVHILTDPMECLNQFLRADTISVRDAFITESDDLSARMTAHYEAFPMLAGAPRQVVNSGTFAETSRDYVVVRMAWENARETDVTMIKDADANYHFSWHAFEQSRNLLLRRYAETAWTGWTHFFVQIKPLDPRTLPTGTILDNLYYRITVPEDPSFEAIGYVDGLSSMATDLRDRFPNATTYQVIADLQRDQSLLDDPRPLFRITSLIRSSWDATP